MRASMFIIWLVSILFSTGVCAQQCVNPVKPNCDFYSQCMEATCRCGFGSTGYAVSYGRKYCQKFLGEKALSAAGVSWRDATLRCLQEKLVAVLPMNGAACDCSKLQSAAYDTHVGCYTQSGSSICDLPETDVLKIKNLVDDSDKSDAAGLKAILQIAGRCIATNPTNAWKIVKAYASEKIGSNSQ